MNIENLTFGQAVESMKQGLPVSRAIWFQGKGGFVFRQVPSSVAVEIIPRMTSLPPIVKQITLERQMPLCYENQLAFVDTANRVSSWAPSVEDALANDWLVRRPYVAASDTVGTATPTE